MEFKLKPLRQKILQHQMEIRSTNRLRPCYELCSAWFLIALSMPEKIIA